jgi:hypothetical protein
MSPNPEGECGDPGRRIGPPLVRDASGGGEASKVLWVGGMSPNPEGERGDLREEEEVAAGLRCLGRR